MAVKTLTLSDRIQSALDDAHAAAQEYGPTSTAAVTAWDIVEELEAEASHQRSEHHKNPFEEYCDEFPEAPEARMYDV